MKWTAAALALLLSTPTLAFECDPEPVLPDNAFPVVVLETSMGNIEVELNRMRAPATVNNFLHYVVSGHYDGTIFHRVENNFVVQGGGYDKDFNEKETRPGVMNESGNGLRNNAFTIAMARFSDPHSATDQFYFNLDNNDGLDPGPRNWGYAVFGDVIGGRDVLEAIAAVEVGYNATVDFQNVPLVPVTLIKATVQ